MNEMVLRRLLLARIRQMEELSRRRHEMAIAQLRAAREYGARLREGEAA